MAHIELEDPADAASVGVVERGLRAFNDRHRADSGEHGFNVLLRDEGGAIVGGCVCFVRWHWLHVDLLWIDDAFRGRGFGTALLRAAESRAIALGCTKSRLDTASFQAQRFYEALGYRVFGRIDDYPPGHAIIYLWKDLTVTVIA